LARRRAESSRHDVMSFKVIRLPINPVRRAKKKLRKAAVSTSNVDFDIYVLLYYLSKRKLKYRADQSIPDSVVVDLDL